MMFQTYFDIDLIAELGLQPVADKDQRLAETGRGGPGPPMRIWIAFALLVAAQ